MLIEIICLFFPALLCVCIYEKLSKVTLNIRHWLYAFALDTLCINLFCFAVNSCILGSGGQPLRPDGINMTPHAALNYLIITVPAAVLLAVAAAFFSKNVSVKIEENGNETN